MRRPGYLLLLFLCCHCVPLNGNESRTVALSSILAPLREAREKTPEKKEVTEAEEENVRSSYRVIKLSDVLSRMEKQLASEIEASSELNLTSRFNWSGLKVRDDLDWDVRLKTPFNPSPNGRWYPSFEFLVDGVVMSNYRIPIQVALFKKIWIVDRNVERGSGVGQPATRGVVRDIYAERVMPIGADQKLDHYEASRSLSKGRVLSWDDLEERPQVRKNAIVDVEFNKGPLEIKMRGRAMDDGMKGDLVTIRNLNTSREFIALVRGENRVEFQL